MTVLLFSAHKAEKFSGGTGGDLENKKKVHLK